MSTKRVVPPPPLHWPAGGGKAAQGRIMAPPVSPRAAAAPPVRPRPGAHVQAAVQLRPSGLPVPVPRRPAHGPTSLPAPRRPTARAVVQRASNENTSLLSTSSGPSKHLADKYGYHDADPYDFSELDAAPTTAPKNALVDKTIGLQVAISRVDPQIAQKGWVRVSSAQYRHSSGATLAISHSSGRIEGQYADSSSRAYKPSYITYNVEGKTLHQDYMESDPERKGIGTVLCLEGLRYAQNTLRCTEVHVSMANDNSGKLMRRMLGEDSAAAASSSCCPCCFLVTACAEARGLPADCAELTTLRAFRDGYLRQRPGGEEMIGLYYQVAPPIVQALWAAPEPAREFEALYRAIRQCVGLIESADLEGALRFYREMVETLAKRFLPSGFEVEALA
jgi:hypothetical protein